MNGFATKPSLHCLQPALYSALGQGPQAAPHRHRTLEERWTASCKVVEYAVVLRSSKLSACLTPLRNKVRGPLLLQDTAPVRVGCVSSALVLPSW